MICKINSIWINSKENNKWCINNKWCNNNRNSNMETNIIINKCIHKIKCNINNNKCSRIKWINIINNKPSNINKNMINLWIIKNNFKKNNINNNSKNSKNIWCNSKLVIEIQSTVEIMMNKFCLQVSFIKLI